MISAGLETAADLRCAFEALNGGSSIFDFKIIGEPKVATGAHGVSGYCLSMWIIAKAPGDQDWDGLLLPCTLLHPETIAVEERGGVKFCQPIFTAPCEKPRAQRVLTDGVNVRWFIPQITGGLVKIPELENPFSFPEAAIAWRCGGADDTYLPPPPRTKRRRDQREKVSKARAGADNGTFDAIAHHLNTSWGPRSLRGWCEGIGLRLSAHGALTAHAEEAAKVGPAALIPKLLSAKPPCPTVVMAACREARCKTLFCQYLIGATDARGKLIVSRRIRSAAEAGLPPSPTRAGARQNPGKGSPGASVPVDGGGWQVATSRGKKAKVAEHAGPASLAPTQKQRPTLSFDGLSPAATLRGMAIAPGGTGEGGDACDLT
tara:strand:- start:297 stop:1421 length:1125 start_codon:yes stop_codon:yes gene_type:complete